ncbi:hypothetical protein PtA15_15A6 [Puccinia triticina]|nr:uncharacterized protein PtA15_15A6 [Puccinia triticina]WAQ91617.1 hypothetical protein PtA15_15A6 [Puccinia triticina]
MQNHNGPCSLLAICNVLLLRGSILLPGPPTRTSISFTSLLSLLADYLVRQNLQADQLHAALSTIPTTQTGLDLNPRFGSIDGFRAPSRSSAAQGLDLFSAVGIPLVHGWIADSQDFDTWDVVVGKCGDYDKAVELAVTGEELLAKQLENPHLELRQEEQSLLREALLLRRFLDSTSTQLSYPGLFQLASGIAPDSLVALLRNSHLSVLYRRPVLPVHQRPPAARPAPPLPPPPDQTDPDYDHQTALEVHALSLELAAAEEHEGQPDGDQEGRQDDPRLPKLFTLATDLAFLHEPQIVWESLEDVEGGLSEFYDWKLARSCLNTHRAPTQAAQSTTHPSSQAQPSDTDTDLSLAHQLQEEEYQRVRRAEQRSGHQPNTPSGGGVPSSAPPRRPAQPQPPHLVTATVPLSSTKKKKKDCVIV